MCLSFVTLLLLLEDNIVDLLSQNNFIGLLTPVKIR